MKFRILFGFWLLFTTGAVFAQQGYKIDLTIKPYQNQWVYLAYYYGSIKGLADSAYLDANSRGVFRGPEPLQQGVYIVASPNKTILFEMLLPEDQEFAVSMDTLQPDASLRFTGSEENDRFHGYTRFIGPRAQKAEEARKQMEGVTDDAEKKKLEAIISGSMEEINAYRLDVIEKYPESMLALLFKTMQDTPLPEQHRSPRTRDDSIAQYRWAKTHYWDNIDFMDGRLVRTPVFDNKLKNYINNWVVPDADSIIYEMNWMMALGRNDPEMSRYLISYFIDNYIYPKIMGQDKVFLHAYEKYVANDNPMTSWLNEKQRKTITERAYMVMANQLGAPAYDMALVDTAGKVRRLYDVKSDYVVISFWDPNCGKCREDMPKIDSLYKSTWKKQNVQVYAVMVNEDALGEWKKFIGNTGKEWVHVHQTKEMRDAEEKAGQANFRQLYDMRSTPTLFLLDKEKRIVAKNLGLEDLDNVLQQKIRSAK
ncbi:MAG TPA: thioredoxin-like domain-containing protein [Phnomibacter sp.]|nr:thioredoxin-like domain-containing protein [Phnomibacter sp.]